MKVERTALEGVLVLEPRVFEDGRGWFYESWNLRGFREATGVHADFVQDNHSRSARNVLRGLHYQLKHPQGKLVRVTAGAAYDVVVDLRRSSRSFGRAFGTRLDAASQRMLWIPAGFAHGFVALRDGTEVQYKTTDYYAPQHERTLLWNDPALDIAWPLEGDPVLAEKDRMGVALSVAETFD